MNHIYRIKQSTMIDRHERGKSAHGQKKATAYMELEELEEKARVFYKLAVVKDRKYRFRTYRSTFVGKEMVDSMVVSGLAASREQAVELGRAIAKNFDLFENCEKKFSNKMTYFEDEPTRLYRFTSGALQLIRKINEKEIEEDDNSVPTTFTTSVSTSSNYDRPIRGPGLQRQNGTRAIKSYTNTIENNASENDVSHKNKIFDRQKKATVRLSRTPMYALFEEDNESSSSSFLSGVSITNTESTEVGRQKVKPRPSKVQSMQVKIVEFDEREMNHRLFTESQSGFQNKSSSQITSSYSVPKTIEERDGSTTSVNPKEKLSEHDNHRLRKSRFTKWDDKNKSIFDEVDTEGLNVFPDDCRNIRTRTPQENDGKEQKGEDQHTSLIDEFDTEATGSNKGSRENSPDSSKGRKSTRRSGAPKPATNTMPPNEQIIHGGVEPSEQVDPKSIVDPPLQEESEDQDHHLFVTSPNDLPAGFRRRMSDNTESFDNFEFILNKIEGNLLAKGDDDDRSMWTEYIIGDEEGRKRYRQNELKQRCPSRIPCVGKTVGDDIEFTVVNNETVYEDAIYDEEVLAPRFNWEPSGSPALASKNIEDDASYMDFTIFDNTVAISYVEDDDDYIAPEAPPQPKDEDEKSLFHIFTNRANIQSGDEEDDDDDMTQITMDNALMRQPEKNHYNHCIHLSASTGSREAEKSHLTSKNRIQTILWIDLSSSDFPVVRSAMEELRRIVVSEPESRERIVRMGGVMAIMGTMEKHSEREVIQYYCCVIIELLASMEPEAMKAFNEMKGIQMIGRSMQDQADSDRIQEAGRAALATLCRTHQAGEFY